ncbi:MAG: hypothetical protein WB562_03365 [Candidatus Sulfotelmatobacter sp.]
MLLFQGRSVAVLMLAGMLIPLWGCGLSSPASGTGGFGMTNSGQATVARVTLNPSSVTGGDSAQITVTLAEAAPASGLSVVLSSSDPTVANTPDSLGIGAGQTTATATLPTTAVSGTTSVAISASYNGSTAGASLSVLPSNSTGTFTAIAQPATVTVQQGQSGASTITTQGSSGYNQALQLSVSGEPGGVTASLNPQTIAAPGSGTSQLTLTVASSVQTGSYPLSVTASDGNTSESAALTLNVTSGASNPNATFKGCWYKQTGHRYQAVDVSAGNPGTYSFNAVLYNGATCDANSFADQFGFGQLIQFGGFGFTFWFSDFKDQTAMSALWYVGDESSQCVNYAVAPDC